MNDDDNDNDSAVFVPSAGYDVIIIESVGLGQSEVDIDQAVDMLLIVVPPGGGDGLQASKKGIMEAADLVLVNKADGNLLEAAKHTKADYSGAMHFIRQKQLDWHARVMLMSAATGLGLEDVEAEIRKFHSLMCANGSLEGKRGAQAVSWMWSQLRRQLVQQAESDEAVKNKALEVQGLVHRGHMTPASAASVMVQSFLDSNKR